MQRTPEGLVFERDECDPLCRILSMYFRSHKDELTKGELRKLQSVWKQASDLTLMEEGDTHANLARRISIFAGRRTALKNGQTTVETSDAPLFTRIIGWAGVNLAEGTTTIQDMTRDLLDVTYDDPEIQAVFEEADSYFATEYYPGLLIAAGELAQTWSTQLAE